MDPLNGHGKETLILQNELNRLQQVLLQTSRSFDAEKEASDSRLHDLQQRLSAAAAENVELKASNASLAACLKKVDVPAKSGSDRDNWCSMCEAFEQQRLASAGEKKDESTLAKVELERKHKRALKQVEKTCQDKLEDRERELVSENKRLMKQLARANELRDQSDRAQSAGKANQAAALRLHTEVTTLQQKLTKEEEKSGSLQKELDSIQAEHTSRTTRLTSQLRDTEHRVSELQSKKLLAEKAKAKAEADLESLRQHHEKEQAKIIHDWQAKAQENATKHGQLVRKLQQDCANLQAQLGNAKQQSEDAKQGYLSERASWETQQKEAQNLREALQLRIQQQERAANDTNERIADLQTQFDQAQRDLSVGQAEVAKMEALRVALLEENAELKRERANRQEQHAAEVTLLRTQQHTEEQELSLLRAKIQEQAQLLTEAEQQYEADRSQSKHQMGALRAQVEALETERASLLHQIGDLKESLATTQSQEAATVATLQQELENLEASHEAQLGATHQQLSEVQLQLDAQLQRNAAATESLQAAQRRLSECEEEADRARKQFQLELQQLLQEVQVVRKEVAENETVGKQQASALEVAQHQITLDQQALSQSKIEGKQQLENFKRASEQKLAEQQERSHQELLSLQEVHHKELEDAQASWEARLNTANQTIAQIRSELDVEKQNHQHSVNALEAAQARLSEVAEQLADSQQQLTDQGQRQSELEAAHCAVLEEQTQAHRARLIQAQGECEKTHIELEATRSSLAQQIEMHAAALQNLKISHEEEIGRLQDTARIELEGALDRQGRTHSLALMELQQAHGRRIRELEDAHALRVSELDSAHNEQMRLLESTNASTLANAQAAQNRRAEEVENMHKSALLEAQGLYDERVRQLESNHALALSELQAVHEGQMRQRESSALLQSQAHERRVEELESGVTAMRQQVETANQMIQELRQNLDLYHHKEQLAVENLQGVQAQLAESDKLLKAAQELGENRTRALVESQLAQKQHVAALRRDQELKLAEAQDLHHQEMLSLQEVHAKEVADQHEAHVAQLAAVEAKLGSQMQLLQGTLEERERDALVEKETTQKREQAEQQARADLETAHRRALEESQAQLQHGEAVKQELELKLRELHEAHRMESLRLQDLHEKQIESVLAVHQNQLAAAHQQLLQLQAALDTQAKNHQLTLQSVEELHSGGLRAVQEHGDREVCRLKDEHKAELDGLRSKFEEEHAAQQALASKCDEDHKQRAEKLAQALRETYESEKEALTLSFQAQLSAELGELAHQQEEEKKLLLQQVSEEHKATLEQLMQKFEEDEKASKEALLREFDEAKTQLKEAHKREIEESARAHEDQRVGLMGKFEADRNTERERMRDAHSMFVNGLHAQHSQQIAALQQQIAALEQQIAESKQLTSAAEEALHQTEERCTKLASENSGLQEEKLSQQRSFELSTMESQNQARAAESQAANLRASFEVQLSALHEEASQARNQRLQLTQQLEDSQTLSLSLTQRLSIAEAELQAIAAAAEQAAGLKVENESLQKKAKEFDGEIAKLKKQHSVEIMKLGHKIKMESNKDLEVEKKQAIEKAEAVLEDRLRREFSKDMERAKRELERQGEAQVKRLERELRRAPLQEMHPAAQRNAPVMDETADLEMMVHEVNQQNKAVQLQRTDKPGMFLLGVRRLQLSVIGGVLSVRVGGGFITFPEFISKYGKDEVQRIMDGASVEDANPEWASMTTKYGLESESELEGKENETPAKPKQPQTGVKTRRKRANCNQ